MKFYICEHCGNIVTFLQSSGVPVMCCGQKMTELVPDSTDAAQEKHVPVVTVEGSMVDVKVGSAPHPMIPEHYIQWVALETTEGCQIKYLEPGQARRSNLPSPPATGSRPLTPIAIFTGSGEPERHHDQKPPLPALPAEGGFFSVMASFRHLLVAVKELDGLLPGGEVPIAHPSAVPGDQSGLLRPAAGVLRPVRGLLSASAG